MFDLQFVICDSLYLNSEKINDHLFEIHLSNGDTILCEESIGRDRWTIDGKEFASEDWTGLYRLVIQKLTGVRFTLRLKKDLDELGAVAIEQVDANCYIARLSNGAEIQIEKDSLFHDSRWDWKIGDQYFSHDEYARRYFLTLATEKLTGKRVIFHAKQPVPDICGINGAACRSKGACNTALCSHCPVAEKFFADRDGVELIYAVC